MSSARDGDGSTSSAVLAIRKIRLSIEFSFV
jgi:hypothetical protein